MLATQHPMVLARACWTKKSHMKPIGQKESSVAKLAPTVHPAQHNRHVMTLDAPIGHRAMRGLLDSGAIRAKLEIGPIDDPLEREADQTADRVMSSPMGAGTSCPNCKGENEVVRRSSDGGGLAHKPARVDRAKLALGLGVGLPSALRGFFEPRFERELGHVRVHTEPPAAAGARSIGARAYTLGNDIAFADGHYRPDSAEGRHLLAHELAHVVQGGGNRMRRQPDAGAPAAPQAPGNVGPDASSAADRAADIAAAARDPEPGEHTAGLFRSSLQFGPILDATFPLSDNPAHCRRTLARVIGKLGVEEADDAVSAFEFRASMPWGTEAEKIVAPIARREFGRLKEDWAQFSARVRMVAAMRLEHNIQALGQWADYVAKLSPEHVRADMVASNNLNLVQKAIDRPAVGPHYMPDMAEEWATTTSPGRRGYIELLAKNEIHGGCQDCHVQKSVRDSDLAVPAWHETRVPLFVRSREIALAEFARRQPADPEIMGRTVTGEIPSEEMWAMAAGRPGVATVLNAAEMTRPQFRNIQAQASGRTDFMSSLGAANVIVEGSLDRGLSGEALRDSILFAIATRRFMMAELQSDLQDPDYDFLLLAEMVNRLMGGVDADVRVMIEVTRQTRREEEEERSFLTKLLTVASLILLVTPLAPIGVGIGIGLGVSGIAEGLIGYDQGRDIARGTGAGLFTREQEDAAAEMMAAGMISVALNAVGLALTGIGLAGAGRAGAVADDAAGALVRSEQAAARAGAGESFMPDAIYGRPVFDDVAGTMRVSATRMTAQGAGDTVDLTVNLRTGAGEAVVTTPQGQYIVRFNQSGATEVVSPTGVTTPAPGGGAAGFASAAGGTLAQGAGPTALLPGRGQLALPMAENDFTAINRQVFGSDFGTPTGRFRVSPGGVVIPESPFRPGIPVYLGNSAAPDMLFDETQILRGSMPAEHLSPFDYFLPPSTEGETTQTLAQTRRTPSGGSVSNTRGAAGESYATERTGPGATNAFYEIEVPNWSKNRRPDVRQPIRNTGDTLAVESKNYRYFHNPGGGQPTVVRYVPLSRDIADQVTADALLMHSANSTYRPMWVFIDAPPSTELANSLTRAGIPYVYWGDRLPQ